MRWRRTERESDAKIGEGPKSEEEEERMIDSFTVSFERRNQRSERKLPKRHSIKYVR